MGIMRVQNQRDFNRMRAQHTLINREGERGSYIWLHLGSGKLHGTLYHSAEADIEIQSEKRDSALASHEFSFNCCLRATCSEDINGIGCCKASIDLVFWLQLTKSSKFWASSTLWAFFVWALWRFFFILKLAMSV